MCVKETQITKKSFKFIALCLSTFFLTGYFEENIVLHFASSMISGLVTTAASMPVDIAKTR